MTLENDGLRSHTKFAISATTHELDVIPSNSVLSSSKMTQDLDRFRSNTAFSSSNMTQELDGFRSGSKMTREMDGFTSRSKMTQEWDGLIRSNTTYTSAVLQILQEVRANQAALQKEHKQLQRRLTEWMEHSETRRTLIPGPIPRYMADASSHLSSQHGVKGGNGTLDNDGIISTSKKKEALKNRSNTLIHSHILAADASEWCRRKTIDSTTTGVSCGSKTINADPSASSVVYSRGWSHWTRASGILPNPDDTNLKRLQICIRSAPFAVGVSCMILLQALVMGLEADYRAKTHRPNMFFTVMQLFFAVVFLTELFLRLFVYGRLFFQGREAPWNWFDCVMALVPIFELLEFMIPAASSASSISKMLKIARLARVMRILRVVRFSPQLRIMLFLILEALKSTGSLVFLLVSFLYMFSVLFTMGCTDYSGASETDSQRSAGELRRHFGTVLRSMFTCWKSMAGGVSWGEVVDPLLAMDLGWFYCMIFIIFIVFSVLCFMNIVTGVFVDSAMEKSKTDRDMVIEKHLNQKKAYIQTLRGLFKDGDVDRTGTLSKDEFEEYMNDQGVQAYFDAMNVDTNALAELFSLLDNDGSGEIDFDEFADNLMHVMRARTPDQYLQKLINENRGAARYLAHCMEYVQSMVHLIGVDMKRLPDVHQRCIDELELSLRSLLPVGGAPTDSSPLRMGVAPSTPRTPTGIMTPRTSPPAWTSMR